MLNDSHSGSGPTAGPPSQGGTNGAREASCEEHSLLLPWLVNGTLGESSRLEVSGHLSGCPRCQRDLERLQAVLRDCQRGHPEPLDVARFAAGLEPLTTSSYALAEHVRICPSCREEVALSRRSLTLSFFDRASRVRRAVAPALLAAGLLAAIGFGSARYGSLASDRGAGAQKVAAVSRSSAEAASASRYEPQSLFEDGFEDGVESWEVVVGLEEEKENRR